MLFYQQANGNTAENVLLPGFYKDKAMDAHK